MRRQSARGVTGGMKEWGKTEARWAAKASRAEGAERAAHVERDEDDVDALESELLREGLADP